MDWRLEMIEDKWSLVEINMKVGECRCDRTGEKNLWFIFSDNIK